MDPWHRASLSAGVCRSDVLQPLPGPLTGLSRALLRHEDCSVQPDLQSHQAGAEVDQGQPGHWTWPALQVVCPALPQRQPAGEAGLRVALSLQMGQTARASSGHLQVLPAQLQQWEVLRSGRVREEDVRSRRWQLQKSGSAQIRVSWWSSEQFLGPPRWRHSHRHLSAQSLPQLGWESQVITIYINITATLSRIHQKNVKMWL